LPAQALPKGFTIASLLAATSSPDWRSCNFCIACGMISGWPST
jgi:hypothetical protein